MGLLSEPLGHTHCRFRAQGETPHDVGVSRNGDPTFIFSLLLDQLLVEISGLLEIFGFNHQLLH